MFLGLMAYLDPKGKGNSSMPEKQWPCPGTRSGVLRDPSDTVKARLPESQSPEDATFRPSEMYLKPAPCPASESVLIRCNLRGAERFPMRGFKVTSQALG